MRMYGRTHAASNNIPPPPPPVRQPPKSEIKGWICKANGCCSDGQRRRVGGRRGGGVTQASRNILCLRKVKWLATALKRRRRTVTLSQPQDAAAAARRLAPVTFAGCCSAVGAKRRETHPQMAAISCSLLCGIVGLMVLKQIPLFVWHAAAALLLVPAVPREAIETNGGRDRNEQESGAEGRRWASKQKQPKSQPFALPGCIVLAFLRL